MGGVIQLSTREVLILISAFAALVFGFGKILLSQFERRMQERFKAMQEMQAAQQVAMSDQITALGARVTNVNQRVESLRDELPRQYVTREDWLRFASQMDAKLDRVMEMIMRRNWRDNP